MRNILILTVVFGIFSCSSKEDPPLIIPPNFAEMPDLKNPEKPVVKSNEENIARLKELLLKSEE
jgi:hypothetical protein